MRDRYGRDIRCLRVSVTQACNLRCSYCSAEGEGHGPGASTGHRLRRVLSLEEIASIASAAARLGICKVRLTGGEPLLRPRLPDLVRLLKAIPHLEHVAMTSNGILLARAAASLKAAGLDTVNVSLDTLSPERFASITGGKLQAVLDGIEAAREAGIPVKINMVVSPEGDAGERERVRAFCVSKGLGLQLIEQYELGREKIREPRFDRPHKCEQCDRIRLLADGMLKPCLHSDLEVPVDFTDVERSLRECIEGKPERGEVCTNRRMVEIGG